jgi:hypothetical protein
MSGFVFNFARKFADDVERDLKLQTIRMDRRDGRVPIPGDTAHLYTALRNPTAKRHLGNRVIAECFPVRMEDEAGEPIVFARGTRLRGDQADALARLDGFADAGAMLEWFRQAYHLSAIDGFCVRWQPAVSTAALVGVRRTASR